MSRPFDRKIFTARSFIADIGYLLGHIPAIRRAMRDEALGRDFISRTMMVVTGVNGCTYCTWFHANEATRSGMSEAEILDTFNLQFEAGADPHTLPALLFAQHYAETDRRPEPEMWQRVVDAYGAGTAANVMTVIRMIYFGNLLGNTFDAVLARFRGAGAEGSSRVFEAVFFLLTFWLMLPAKWMMDRQHRREAGAEAGAEA